MAIKFLSSENIAGDIDVTLPKNGITYLAVTNLNTGVSANARVQVVGESAQLDLIATSAGYTGVTGWADSGIISTDSGASGGLKLNSQAGGIQLQTNATSQVIMDANGLVGIKMSPNNAVILSVSGAIGPTPGTQSDPTYTFFGDPDTGMFHSGTNTLGFTTGGTTRLSVRAAGINVIGETETDTLKVTGSTEFTGGATFEGDVNITTGTTDSDIKFNVTGQSYVVGIDYDDSKKFKIASSSNLGTQDRVTLLSTGNVGIGTITPGDKLHIEGGVIIQNGNNLQWGGLYSANAPTIFASTDYIQFAPTGASGVASNSMKLTTTGLGIGTTNPSSKLTVSGPTTADLTGTNNSIRIENHTSANASPAQLGNGIVFSQKWWSGSASLRVTGGIFGKKNAGNGSFGGGLAFYTQPNSGADMAQHMVIRSTGEVGIGTDSPGTKLQVANAGEVIVRSSMTAADGFRGGFEADNQHTGGTIWSMFSTNNSDGYFGGGKYVIANESMGGVDANTTAQFVIDGSGNVGIGTTAPSGELMVRKDQAGSPTRIIVSNNGTVQSGTTARLSFYEGTSEKNYIERRRDGSGQLAFKTPADDNPIVWENASGEFMRFNNSRVGIGTTSPQFKLDVKSNSDTAPSAYLRGGKSSQGEIQNTGLIVGTQTDMVAGDYQGISFTGYTSSSAIRRGRAAIGVEAVNGPGKMDLVFMAKHQDDGSQLLADDTKMIIKGSLTSNKQSRVGIGYDFVTSKIHEPEGTNSIDVYGTGFFGYQDFRDHDTYPPQKVLVLRGAPASGAYAQSRFNWYTKSGTTSNGIAAIQIKSQYGADAESGVLFHFGGNGNVGIGSDSPSAKLDIKGDGADIFLQSNDFKIARIQPRGTGGNYDIGLFSLFSGSTENVRIDAGGNSWFNGGNVGINITNPGQKLTVVGDGSGTSDVVRIIHGNGSHTGNGLNIRSANTGKPIFVDGSVGGGFAEITTAYNANPNIRTSGDVVAYASSDKRFKDNLEVIQNPIDKIHKLNGYTFDWNDKQDVYKGKDYGVVAQEVENVMPELVDTRFDGYKAVKYEKLVPLLIESIKELKAEIEELKKQIK